MSEEAELIGLNFKYISFFALTSKLPGQCASVFLVVGRFFNISQEFNSRRKSCFPCGRTTKSILGVSTEDAHSNILIKHTDMVLA